MWTFSTTGIGISIGKSVLKDLDLMAKLNDSKLESSHSKLVQLQIDNV